MLEGGKKDTGEGILSNTSSWTFKGISENFESHISNSVPLYKESHYLVASLSDFFLTNDSTIVDIGCSTGNLISKISLRQKHLSGMNFLLIDEEKEMLDLAKDNLEINNYSDFKYEFICKDIIDYELPENINIILSMYTLQFTSPSVRQQILNKIYNSLSWGGAFFFFEKVNGYDARFHEILTQNYEDFKLNNGYSIEEIKAKQLSLRGVLKPFSDLGNLGLLERAGFVDIQTIFHFGLFKGYLAIK